MNKVLLSSKKMDWCTPVDFFNKLNKKFHFVLDPAATDKTAKCPLYYTPETDGLFKSWDRGGAVFCNPPYGREIGKWVKKAYEEAQVMSYPIVLLIPARTDTAYFHDYIYGKAEIHFVRGRLRFTDDEGVAGGCAPSLQWSWSIILQRKQRIHYIGVRNEGVHRTGSCSEKSSRSVRVLFRNGICLGYCA